ncbi:MAG: hypothetical protein ABSD79_04890 [Dehalococcoidales bacterium]|jgi:hypothetical protein
MAASIQKGMEGLLREKFKIGHSTLQLECQNCEAGGVLCSLRSGREECPEHRDVEKTDGEAHGHEPHD